MSDAIDAQFGEFLSAIFSQIQAATGSDRISTAVKVAVGFSTIAYNCNRMGEHEIEKQAISLLRETMKGIHSGEQSGPPSVEGTLPNAGSGSSTQ